MQYDKNIEAGASGFHWLYCWYVQKRVVMSYQMFNQFAKASLKKGNRGLRPALRVLRACHLVNVAPR